MSSRADSLALALNLSTWMASPCAGCSIGLPPAGQPKLKYLSSDHDPLFRFHRRLANLRVPDVEEIKSVPYVPVSHPFVERLIGTIRREDLDRVFFRNRVDLMRKLEESRLYYNAQRVHRWLGGTTPTLRAGDALPTRASLNHYA